MNLTNANKDTLTDALKVLSEVRTSIPAAGPSSLPICFITITEIKRRGEGVSETPDHVCQFDLNTSTSFNINKQ
jgi:hypothetical protein